MSSEKRDLEVSKKLDDLERRISTLEISFHKYQMIAHGALAPRVMAGNLETISQDPSTFATLEKTIENYSKFLPLIQDLAAKPTLDMIKVIFKLNN